MRNQSDKHPTVILADDHQMVSSGIAHILSNDFHLLRVVDNGRDLVEAVRTLRPQVAVLDISMPLLNGIEAARQLRQTTPETKLVFLSMHIGSDYVVEALRAGGSAYVLKQSSPAELKHAILAALRGQTYLTPLISNAIPARLLRRNAHKEILTSRQREVLQLIAEGHSAKKIAAILGISVKTAEFHKATIIERLGLRSTAELARYAADRGMVARETSVRDRPTVQSR
jgi:DNA-binding NarL/FixJ family response regulator